MNIKSLVPAVVLATSLCSAAHAAQEDIGVSQPQVSQAQQLRSDPIVQQAPGLTRQQVYDQLVQAEKDGSLARLNATLYNGHGR
jgi:outer membrane protein assembly factor BamE (lipoprotein component of BamABCDE complex)